MQALVRAADAPEVSGNVYNVGTGSDGVGARNWWTR